METNVHPSTTSTPPPTALTKKLSWIDSTTLATATQAGIISGLGYSIGALGAWGAVAVWGAATLIALLQNYLYAEMALMFPQETGGIALFAHQAWKRYTTLVGPVASFGYWFAWSLTLGIYGETIGNIILSQWFPQLSWNASLGPVHLQPGVLIAIATIVLCWALNIVGIRTATMLGRALAVALTAFTAIVMVVPFTDGSWHPSNLQWHVGGWRNFLVWMFIAAWSVYGTELCATFAPEYRDMRRDTVRALRASALFVLAVFVVVPIATTGNLGEAKINANPLLYSVESVDQVFGASVGQALTVVALLCLFLSMLAAQADGGRALLGIAREGMTLRQVEKLNRFGEPGRALTVDAVVNIAIVLLFSSPLVILLASNLGYMICTCAAVAGFLLLRKDRPNWPRPLRLRGVWVAIAVVVLVLDIAITLVGASDPQAAGYGSAVNSFLAIGVLAISLVLYFIRRVIQDRQPVQFRDRTVDVPVPDEPETGH
jgi:amino acid transporter